MIDLVKLSIPFKKRWLVECLSADATSGTYINLQEVSERAGVRLTAFSVEYQIDGDLEVSGLTHPFDSLPSYWSGVSMKIHAGGALRHPSVELKASPAKILQGHNVFGSDSIELCAFELLFVLAEAMPELYDMLDVEETALDWLDVTFSARTGSTELAMQALNALRHVSSGQMKASKQSRSFDTTCYWNKGSRHCERKAYLKSNELQREITEIQRKTSHYSKASFVALKDAPLFRRAAVLNDPRLIEWATGIVRFESRLKQRWLQDFGLPYRLFDAIEYQKDYEKDGANLISDMWCASFKELTSAIEGKSMNIYDDEKIHVELKKFFFKLNPSGSVSYAKANRVFGFYRRLVNEGYDAVYQTMSRSTFFDQQKCLVEIGLSKDQLQQLHGERDSNVVPLIRMINIDFKNQVPSWYKEPVSRYIPAESNIVAIRAA